MTIWESELVHAERARRRIRLGLQCAARPGALEDLTGWLDEGTFAGVADNVSLVDAFADQTYSSRRFDLRPAARSLAVVVCEGTRAVLLVLCEVALEPARRILYYVLIIARISCGEPYYIR